METRWTMLFAAMVVLSVMTVPDPAVSQVSDFYKDKVVTIVVAGSPAGGHTRYARMIAPYIKKHAGMRDVRIANMAGGGGLIAANHLWRSKPDGFNIVFGNVPTLILAPIAGSAGVLFDATKLTYLGRATSEPRLLLVGGKSPIKTIQDVQKLNRPFVYPSQGTDEDFYAMAFLSDALSFKMKAVTGLPGLTQNLIRLRRQPPGR